MHGKSPFLKRLRAYAMGEIGHSRWFRYNVRRPMISRLNGFWARKIGQDVIDQRINKADLSNT